VERPRQVEPVHFGPEDRGNPFDLDGILAQGQPAPTKVLLAAAAGYMRPIRVGKIEFLPARRQSRFGSLLPGFTLAFNLAAKSRTCRECRSVSGSLDMPEDHLAQADSGIAYG